MMGRREMGRKLTGSVVSLPLYNSMSLVYLSASGYCASSIDLLKSGARMGGRKSLRSLMMAGVMLKMSVALLGLVFRM